MLKISTLEKTESITYCIKYFVRTVDDVMILLSDHFFIFQTKWCFISISHLKLRWEHARMININVISEIFIIHENANIIFWTSFSLIWRLLWIQTFWLSDDIDFFTACSKSYLLVVFFFFLRMWMIDAEKSTCLFVNIKSHFLQWLHCEKTNLLTHFFLSFLQYFESCIHFFLTTQSLYSFKFMREIYSLNILTDSVLFLFHIQKTKNSSSFLEICF